MRMFTPTKILLLLTLLAANLGPAKTALAQSCPDPNCCKTCGAIWAGAETTRSCTGGTCWITSCSFHATFAVVDLLTISTISVRVPLCFIASQTDASGEGLNTRKGAASAYLVSTQQTVCSVYFLGLGDCLGGECLPYSPNYFESGSSACQGCAIHRCATGISSSTRRHGRP